MSEGSGLRRQGSQRSTELPDGKVRASSIPSPAKVAQARCNNPRSLSLLPVASSARGGGAQPSWQPFPYLARAPAGLRTVSRSALCPASPQSEKALGQQRGLSPDSGREGGQGTKGPVLTCPTYGGLSCLSVPPAQSGRF